MNNLTFLSPGRRKLAAKVMELLSRSHGRQIKKRYMDKYTSISLLGVGW
jgi:hypothetical protein